MTAKMVGSKNQSCCSKTVWVFDQSSNFFGPIQNFDKEKFLLDKKGYISNKVQIYSAKEKEDINPKSNKLATESSINFGSGFISAEKKSNVFFSVIWANYDFKIQELRISRGSGHITDTVDYFKCQELN